MKVTVIHDHSTDTPPYPAVEVQLGVERIIVKREELLSPEEIEAQRKFEHQCAVDSVQNVVKAFQAGNITLRALAVAMQVQMIDILSKARKAERLGLIKLVKENMKPEPQPGPEPQVELPEPGKNGAAS